MGLLGSLWTLFAKKPAVLAWQRANDPTGRIDDESEDFAISAPSVAEPGATFLVSEEKGTGQVTLFVMNPEQAIVLMDTKCNTVAEACEKAQQMENEAT